MTTAITELAQKSTGVEDVTHLLQEAINDAANHKETMIIPKGKYLVGSLFIPSNMHLHFEKGAELIGNTDLKAFKEVYSRVAGVEMTWPAAILNVLNGKNVLIDGYGTINGSGPYWWDQYWGQDQHSGRRKWFEEHNLRWIADYEIKRPRSILFYKTIDSTIKDLHIEQSGFWNLQLNYCSNIEVTNLKIDHNEGGPSTDGIDVDSSKQIHIHDCSLSCDDDCIVLKSGRDGDGFRINKPTEDVEIDHCTIYSGYGITIGSEVTGGIKNIHIHDNYYDHSKCGFRIKSSTPRAGYIENIKIDHLKMVDVTIPFSWVLNWFVAYNKKVMPDNAKPMWRRVAAQIPKEHQHPTRINNIEISDIKAKVTNSKVVSRLFDVEGFSELPINNIQFNHCQLQANEFGPFFNIKNIHFNNSTISIGHQDNKQLNNFDNR